MRYGVWSKPKRPMLSFRLRNQSNYESVAAPEFNIATVDQPLGLLDRLCVIGAS